jgi:hypothetical protein
MTVQPAIASLRAEGGIRPRALDLALGAGVVAFAALIGIYATGLAHGLIPAQNALFDADSGRVLADYTGVAENYYRLKVHPWQGWLFVVYQVFLAKVLPAPVAVPLISVAIGMASAGLLYAVLRRLAIGPWLAASHTLLFLSCAGFVFWSSVPEAHMAGGAATLMAVFLLADERPSRWRSIIALAVSFSMVVTDAAVWFFRQIEFAALRRGWRDFVRVHRVKLPELIRQGAWSVAVIVVVWAPQWLFLHKRIGVPFNFLEERHYVDVGSGGSSVHVLGILPPDHPAGLVLSLAAAALLLAALRVLPRRLWFIPAFPLFGVVLHAVYGSDSAFLFAPNYLPLFSISLALVGAKLLPKWSAPAALAAAAVLLTINLGAYRDHLDTLKAAGQMKTYQAAVHYE